MAIPLTIVGAEMLRAELHKLKTVERPAVIASIAEARAHGDLSENAEYDAAKEKQSFVEGRILEIESKLSNAQVVDPKLVDADGACVFGSTVDLEDVNSKEKVTYQIVGEDEADLKVMKVSISSPIARALIGKYAGDQVDVQAPGGVKQSRSWTSSTCRDGPGRSFGHPAGRGGRTARLGKGIAGRGLAFRAGPLGRLADFGFGRLGRFLAIDHEHFADVLDR